MPEVMWEGRFISAVREGHWEYVRRTRGISAAVILAETDDREIILVEQYRIPIGRRCLELPAGLIERYLSVNRDSHSSLGHNPGRRH